MHFSQNTSNLSFENTIYILYKLTSTLLQKTQAHFLQHRFEVSNQDVLLVGGCNFKGCEKPSYV